MEFFDHLEREPGLYNIYSNPIFHFMFLAELKYEVYDIRLLHRKETQ